MMTDEMLARFRRGTRGLALELPEAVYRDDAPLAEAAAEEIARLRYALEWIEQNEPDGLVTVARALTHTPRSG